MSTTYATLAIFCPKSNNVVRSELLVVLSKVKRDTTPASVVTSSAMPLSYPTNSAADGLHTANLVVSPAAEPARARVRVAPSERKLSVNELDTLCTAFLKVPGMRERSHRDLYVDELNNNQLRNALSFSRHHDPHHDVWALLRACQDHRNGIRALATILRSFHRGSRPMIELDELIECLFPDELLDADERDQLTNLLGGIEPQQLQLASRYAGSPAYMTTLDWSDPAEVARRLESCIGRVGAPHPLLVFIDFLAHQLDLVRSAEQHRWIDKVGIRNNVSLSSLRELCVAANARLAEAQRFYFIVHLEPDRIDPDGHYLMSVWLQHHHSVEEQLQCEDTPLTLSEVADRLPELLSQAHAALGAGSGDLVLEFILPRGLISHPIDQWEVDRVFPHRLGTSYPLVVRSLDRLRNLELHGLWRTKWRELVKNGHREDPDTLYWLLDQNTLAPSSLRANLITDPTLVALAIAFPLDDSVDPSSDELYAALYAGVPVALWCRDHGLGSRFEPEVRALLAGRGLAELPTQVLQLRQNADKDDETSPSLGRHLTLMWDDADRVPQSFLRKTKLRAPQ